MTTWTRPQLDRPPKPRRLADFYDENGLLLSYYASSRKVSKIMALIESKQHEAAAQAIKDYPSTNGYRLPLGVRLALKQSMTHVQLTHQFPWAVVWVSPKSGKRKRIKCGLLTQAVHAHHRLYEQGIEATIISRSRGYDIPPALRGRLKKSRKWCPHCMKPVRMQRVQPDDFFYARVWVETDKGWEQVERRLPLTRCPTCGNTNRDHVFRRSNQNWKRLKIAQGVRRVRRRR